MNSPHLPCTSLPSPQAKIRKNRRDRQIVWVRRSNNEVQIPSSPLLGNVLPWLQTLHFVFITPGWLWISDMHIGKLSIFSSVAQSCLTFCNLVDYNTPGFPVHHQLLELAQMHVCQVGDAIQPSHPLSSPSATFNLQASGSFLVSQFFTSGGQSLRVSALASVIPMNIQDWFPLGWIGCISLRSKGLLRVFQHHSSKATILLCLAFFIVQLSHPYMTTGKTIASTRRIFVVKVISLLFNMLSRFVIAFLPRSKHLLFSWLH